jgi:hypothetical protein
LKIFEIFEIGGKFWNQENIIFDKKNFLKFFKKFQNSKIQKNAKVRNFKKKLFFNFIILKFLNTYTITNWRVSLSKICHDWPNNTVTHECVFI